MLSYEHVFCSLMMFVNTSGTFLTRENEGHVTVSDCGGVMATRSSCGLDVV